MMVARSGAFVVTRLRRIFHKGADVRTVLTSTRMLARLQDHTEIATSPFLQGFIPPLYLTPLAADECMALLSRGSFSPEEVELIMARTANHPFLAQLIASRVVE